MDGLNNWCIVTKINISIESKFDVSYVVTVEDETVKEWQVCSNPRNIKLDQEIIVKQHTYLDRATHNK